MYNPKYPYGVIRIMPGVYQVVEPEAGVRDLRERLQIYAVLAEKRCCLVLDRARCIYFGPDGSRQASAQVPQGICLRLQYSIWIREGGRHV